MFEGLSLNYGDIAPLKAIVELAKEYKYRIILDDSQAMGTLAPLGSVTYARDVLKQELAVEDIDILVGALDTALGSTGAFVVGSNEVCYHQTLSSTGYVFTASAPPFECTVATLALGQICSADGQRSIRLLQANAKVMRDALNAGRGRRPWMIVGGARGSVSPLIHVRLDQTVADRRAVIERVCELCQGGAAGPALLLCAPQYLTIERPVEPSLRIHVLATHNEKQLRTAAATILETLSRVHALQAGADDGYEEAKSATL